MKARTRKLIHLLKGGYPVVADLPWLKGNVFGYNEERKVFRVREGAVTLEIPFEAPERTDVVLAPIEGTIILDMVEEKIACVEVLDRPEVREKLLAVSP